MIKIQFFEARSWNPRLKDWKEGFLKEKHRRHLEFLKCAKNRWQLTAQTRSLSNYNSKFNFWFFFNPWQVLSDLQIRKCYEWSVKSIKIPVNDTLNESIFIINTSQLEFISIVLHELNQINENNNH